MSSLYSPPPIAGIGPGPSGNGSYAPTKSPYFTLSNQFLPRNLHDVIRWVQFITLQSPVTTEVLRKLATYPITEYVIDTPDAGLKKKYLEAIKGINLTTALHQIGFQYFTIGNVFLSIYKPFLRSLKCPRCKFAFPLNDEAKNVRFRNWKFEGVCPKCASNRASLNQIFQQNPSGTIKEDEVEFLVVDIKSVNVQDMNLIVWDPTHIVVNYNPISGKSTYYYTIPNDVKNKIRNGDLLFLSSIPMEFIEAVRQQQSFKFSHGSLFHLRNVDTGFSTNGICVPPLVSHYNLVFYQATLRKANESIAGDYMTPTRVVFPQPQTGNSDPVVSMSMRNFAAKMEEMFVNRKTDPNSVLISPVPIGYQALSGEGKTLLVSQEIQQAEQSLLLSLGVSQELLSGSTNWTSSAVGLRMLKKTLESYTGQLDTFFDWLSSEISTYFTFKNASIRLLPFQLTDDEMIKNIFLQLSQNGQVSMTTLFDAMGRNYDEELEKIREEAINKSRSEVRMQYELSQARYAEALEVTEQNKDSSYKEALDSVQDTIEELRTIAPEEMAKTLQALRVNDFAKYILIMDEFQKEAMESQNVTSMSAPQIDPATGMVIPPGAGPQALPGANMPLGQAGLAGGSAPDIGGAAMNQPQPFQDMDPSQVSTTSLSGGNMKAEANPSRDISGASPPKPKPNQAKKSGVSK